MNLFLDTNVLIDVLTGREGSTESCKLFAYAHLGYVTLIVSALSFVNAVYICKRHGMNVSDVIKSLQAISKIVTVCGLSGDNVSQCLSRGWKDYEDCTQDFSAQEVHAHCIVTHNVKDFNESSLTILTPEQILSFMEQTLAN